MTNVPLASENEGTDSWAHLAWWPADWSQFLPDLINTAVVGLIVGVVIWQIQRIAEKRSARVIANNNWIHARQAVLSAAAGPWFRGVPDVDFWKSQINDIQIAADDLDLVALQSALPGNNEVKALADIVRNAPALDQATKELRDGVMSQLPIRMTDLGLQVLREARERYFSEVLDLADPDPYLATNSRIPDSARDMMTEELRIESETYLARLEELEAAYGVLHRAAKLRSA